MHLRKLSKRGGSYTLNVPAEYVATLGWEYGQKLVLSILPKSRTLLVTENRAEPAGDDSGGETVQ